MVQILLCISLLFLNQMSAMNNIENDFETEEQFDKSLDDDCKVGTSEHRLETKNFTLMIEDNNLTCCSKVDGNKKVIINPTSIKNRITFFTISPDEKQILALQSPDYDNYHNGLWVADLTKNTCDDYRSICLHWHKIYTHLAISNYKTVAIGNDSSIILHQCEFPDQNMKEKYLFKINYNEVSKKLISMKFNKRGTHFGYKRKITHNNEHDFLIGIVNLTNDTIDDKVIQITK